MEDLLSRAIADLQSAPRLLPLKPAVQAYAWGGHSFIPSLLGEANEAGAPRAELWIGSHPLAPARVVLPGGEVSLAALFERAAETLVGADLTASFGRTLPYLLKVLDVRSMLSIQAHPDAAQAREGFAREESRGVPRGAPDRNYRDASHKPEASVALTDFWMLYGFQPVEAIAETLRAVPELAAVFRAAGAGMPVPAGPGREAGGDWLRSAYAGLMQLPQAEVDRALAPLAARLAGLDAAGRLERSMPDFWAARAARNLRRAEGGVDRGLVSVYLLNLVRLAPGEGVFIPAGVLHAYLEGVAVEIMAASDNVIRGGLTPKHVDVAELLNVVRPESVEPRRVHGQRAATGELVYPTPAREFCLGRLDLQAGERFSPGPVWGADALLVLEGAAEIRAAGRTLPLRRGGCVLAPCGLDYTVEAAERAVLVRASVPRPLQ